MDIAAYELTARASACRLCVLAADSSANSKLKTHKEKSVTGIFNLCNLQTFAGISVFVMFKLKFTG